MPRKRRAAAARTSPILDDGDLSKFALLPIAPEGDTSWIQWEFPQPQIIRAFTIAPGGKNPFDAFLPPGGDSGKALEASDDGVTFRIIAAVPKGGATEHTVSFAPVTAKFFRLTFKTLPAGPNPFANMDTGEGGVHFPPPPKDYQIAELVLHSGARVNRFEEKAALNPMPDLYQFATVNVTETDAIQKKDVVDLTSKMHPDGTLDWTPPPGNWVVLRFGYSLLGITNHPATEEATGLEVDKLNSTYVRNYMDHYLDTYKSTVSDGLMGKRGIKYVITDSWEAGAQNWTDDMIAQFTKRRGYDPRPWMPVLTGHVVESAQASDAFLWDLRKTIADLTADEHYGQVEASIKAHGMGHYGESHKEGARSSPMAWK